MNEVLKIIIADDNQIAVDMIKRKIEENEKYKVIGIAKDEEEEIKLIKDIKPNLVITDIRKKRVISDSLLLYLHCYESQGRISRSWEGAFLHPPALNQ